MFIPLKDDLPSRTAPVVTVGLIALNVLLYLYQFSLQFVPSGVTYQEAVLAQRAAQEFVFEFGLIPARITEVFILNPLAIHTEYLRVFTSMFLHGGFFHVAGNMLYLWIFGNNIEDAMGHLRFFVFYLISGVAAAFAQIAIEPNSQVPMIGASGAVSGILGAYLLLYPYAGVISLLVLGFFIRVVRVPALFVLGFWIVVQFLNGLITYTGGPQGGVAWFAHIGGFLAGLVLVNLFRIRPRIQYRR